MKHTMNLNPWPFEAIRSGRKQIEVRLHDEKRSKVRPGDTIEFYKLPDRQESLEVEVKELLPFRSFQEMYTSLPLNELDAAGRPVRELLEETYEIYTPEQEAKWGVLGIRVSLL
ncbi:ASCH domain-containing protein [Paenibacillus sp. M1]|uniref:ASCH domain-containing protein n=1 Tax=Paenibacillus haidiansis TaxID=1574488 RepID=A0ABU7VZ21_9BACL